MALCRVRHDAEPFGREVLHGQIDSCGGTSLRARVPGRSERLYGVCRKCEPHKIRSLAHRFRPANVRCLAHFRHFLEGGRAAPMAIWRPQVPEHQQDERDDDLSLADGFRLGLNQKRSLISAAGHG